MTQLATLVGLVAAVAALAAPQGAQPTRQPTATVGPPLEFYWSTNAQGQSIAVPREAPTTSSMNGPGVSAPGPTRGVSISGPSTPEDIAGTSPAAQAILDAVNAQRAQWSANSLPWDAEYAKMAQSSISNCQWANFDGDGMPFYYRGWGWGGRRRFSPSAPIKSWSEGSEKYKDPNYTQMSLFSNLVWKDTTKIGCAWVWGCTDNNAEWGYILLCVSDWEGSSDDFKQNVGPFVG